MLPSECVLDRRVLSDGDADLDATGLPLFILECMETKAEGYPEDKLKIYNKRLQDMKIGVRLAEKPPAVSHLAILHARWLSARIVDVDKTAIVISLHFQGEEGPSSYLIYDAVALSLRMIPAPRDPSWYFIISSSVSLARPNRGRNYALVHTGQLVKDCEDRLFLWRPSSSSRPWSENKKADIPYGPVHGIHTKFSFYGHAYWMDLLSGGFLLCWDALLDDTSSVLEFGGYIPLPVKPMDEVDKDGRMASPDAYRTMGVVCDTFIRFVSIDGFQDFVKLKKRTVTVWKLLDDNEEWVKEHEFSLKTLWGFEGFGNTSKELTPMYPLLSTNDEDVLYLGLGDYRETKIVRASLPTEWEFVPYYPQVMLAVDMRNKIIRTIVPMDPKICWLAGLVSCGISSYLQNARVEPCDDVAEAPIPMKKKKKKRNPRRKHQEESKEETSALLRPTLPSLQIY